MSRIGFWVQLAVLVIKLIPKLWSAVKTMEGTKETPTKAKVEPKPPKPPKAREVEVTVKKQSSNDFPDWAPF